MEDVIRRRASAADLDPIPARPSLLNGRTLAGLLGLVALLWSLQQAGMFRADLVNEGGWRLFWRFVQASIRAEVSFEFLALTADATLITLAYAVAGTTLSLVLGGLGGLLSSELWWQSVLTGRGTWRRFRLLGAPWLAMRGALAIPRGIHEVIWGLFFINVLGLDPLVAILAIGLPFGAIVAKVFAEVLDETPREPMTVLLNSGTSPLQAFLYGLLPQAFPNLLSYSFYRFECSIRSSAILGIIGAGGLGYQILLSLQSLRYEQVWTLLYALFLLSGLSDFWSSLLRRRLNAPTRIEMNAGRFKSRLSDVRSGERVVTGSLALVALLVPLSFWYVQADFRTLFSPRAQYLLAGLGRDSVPPDVSPELVGSLWHLSTQTLAMSILAIAGAGLGGVLLSFLAANNFLLPGGILNLGPRRVHGWLGIGMLVVTRAGLLVARALPIPVWALILVFVFFPGILPGAIALALYNLGILGRLMAEVIENLDQRPLRALQAQGASGPQVFAYGVLPRTMPGFTAYILYRWEVCIRETVIVGLVGAGGLGLLLTEQLSRFDYRGVLTTLICFVVLTFCVDLASAAMRRSLR